MPHAHVKWILSAYVCEYTVFTIEAPNSVSWENAKNGSFRNIWRYKSTIVNFKCLIKLFTHYLAYEQLCRHDLKWKNTAKGV